MFAKRSFQHIITGAKSPAPQDFLGGILADDMGLGKSLTMLSAIVSSLERAGEYVLRGPCSTVSTTALDPPKTAKSTLIVVPSARKPICIVLRGVEVVKLT